MTLEPRESHCVQQQQHISPLTQAGNPDWEQTKPPRLLKAGWLQRWITAALTRTLTPRTRRDSRRGQGETSSEDSELTPELRLLVSALFSFTDDLFKARNGRISCFSSIHFLLIAIYSNQSQGQLEGAVEFYILMSSGTKIPQRWIRYWKVDQVNATYQRDWKLNKKGSFIDFHRCHYLWMLVESAWTQDYWFSEQPCAKHLEIIFNKKKSLLSWWKTRQLHSCSTLKPRHWQQTEHWGKGQTGSSLPANIIMCWKFPFILCLRPRLSRKDSG